LARFIGERDEAAFAALMDRHGAMVLGVCRRLLRNGADVEDAFQATFLVLVRKAHSLAGTESLGPWLYGVACRTSRKAQAQASRLHLRTEPVAEAPAAATDDLDRQETLGILDEEIHRLPARYREPLILTSLEGRTHQEVALLLRCPRETISTRVARARQMLKQRLTRRGLALTSLTAAALVPQTTCDGAVPAGLVGATARAATCLAGGVSFDTGVAVMRAALLAERVSRSMFLTRWLTLLATSLGAAALAVGMGSLAYSFTSSRPGAAVPMTADPPAPDAVPKGAATKARPAEEGDAALKGSWKIVSAELAGAPREESFTMTFADGTYTIKGRTKTDQGDYRADPSQRPRHIDFVRKDPKKGPAPGIYEIDGDTLRICYARSVRPKSFTTTKDDEAMLLVFKRVPPPDKE
jgi:RNA polymerase sigma-70 factor (ECF subfamily)